MAYSLCKGEETYLYAGIIKISIVCVLYIVYVDVRGELCGAMFSPSTFTQVLGIKLRSPRLVQECLTTEPPQSPRTYF